MKPSLNLKVFVAKDAKVQDIERQIAVKHNKMTNITKNRKTLNL